MEFDKVGRLAPIQSTRGFGLSGQPYTFQPPIKPKPKKRAKRRGKAGKIVFDNRRAKYFREVNMGIRAPLRRNIHRNSTDAGRNPYDHIGRDDSLIRPDNNREVVIKIENANDRRLDRDVEEIQDVVDRELRKHRDQIRQPAPDFLALEDRGIRRAPAIEEGRPLEDRGAIRLGFVPPEQRGKAPIQETPLRPQAPPPQTPDPKAQGLVEEAEPSDIEKTLSLSVDAPQLLVEIPEEERFTPLRDREGIGGYKLRDTPAGILREIDESGREISGEDDPKDSDFSPTPERRRSGSQRIRVVEEPTAEGFLEDQLRAQQDAEAERIIDARKQRRKSKKTPKAQRENPRLETGDVDNAEREVNRVLEDDERSRGSLSAGAKEGKFKRLRKRLSISKTPRGQPEGAIFVAGETPPVEALPQFFPSPFPRADQVGDKTQLGVGGVRYDNPIDESEGESSDVSVLGVLDVLEGGKIIPQGYKDVPAPAELGSFVAQQYIDPPQSDLE